MFAGAVNAAIWFFVQQYIEVMLACDTLHQVHDKLVVVVCQVAVFEDGSQLELVGSYFVVTGLGRDAQFVTFDFEFLHKCGDI